MPKINANGQPSYAGVSGVVTNAVGEQFELDPNVNADGTDADNAQSQDERADLVSLDGPEQLSPSTGTDAALAEQDDAQPVDEPVDKVDGEQDGNDLPKRTGDQWDPAKKNAPAKKTAPAKK
jgi:hypothetical protein